MIFSRLFFYIMFAWIPTVASLGLLFNSFFHRLFHGFLERFCSKFFSSHLIHFFSEFPQQVALVFLLFIYPYGFPQRFLAEGLPECFRSSFWVLQFNFNSILFSGGSSKSCFLKFYPEEIQDNCQVLLYKDR